MLEAKIEQLTAAVVAMTERLDRFNAHFEYVLAQQPQQAQQDTPVQPTTPTPSPTPSTPTPPPTTPAPATEDYTALRSLARTLCIKAVQQKKMKKDEILKLFSQFKDGCDVVDNLPDAALPVIIATIKDKGVTQ